MKKKLSLLCLAFIAALSASAQMIAYTVQTKVQGSPGTPVVLDLQGNAGVDFNGLMIDAEGNLEFNDVIDAKAFPIGFDFGYNSKVMKYFLVATNGMIQLSPTETVSSVVHKNSVTVFTDNGNHDAFGLIMRNGMFGYDDTQISYWLEGDDVLCIQYKNVGLQTASYMTDKKDVAKATIEYRLYQKSGNIEMKLSGFKPYDDADVGNSNFMRIGILGDTGDFIQIQSYDGSVISAKDNSVSYDAENYPADGTVYTFVAPEPCQTPATAPSNLVLSTTSTQISGSFTAGSSDHYLVLASTSEMTETPADNQKYAVGDEIGGAKVIAVVEGTEFVGPDNMEPNQSYNVYVYGFNSLCSAGPLYNSTPATASMVTKPGAPESLTFNNVEKNALSVSVTANGSAPVLVAMTNQQAQGQWDEYIDAGTFGVPAGNYNVGDEIEGGGKVIFIGSPGEAIQVDGLQVGTPYFFRAWSGDGNGGYSSEYVEGTEVTVAELPWSVSIDEKVGYEATMPGWTFNDPEEWNSDPDEGYLFHRMSYIDDTGNAVAWIESPFISLAEGANRIKTAISATAGGGWMSGDWTLGDNDKIVFQLTKDGVEYKDVFTIDKDNAGSLLKGGYTPFTGAFEEMAGETVRLRISIHRSIAGDTRFNKLLIEQKPDLEEPVNLAATDIVGGTVTLEWTPQGDEAEWEVEYKTAEEESWSEAVVVSEPKITIEDLLGLTPYEARVRAIKDGKQSAWSDVAAFTTGFSVPFDFILQGAKNMDGWKTYTGQLGETTTLEEGGDIVIRTSGWGTVMYRTLFNPMSNSTASWLVSPKFAVGDDASRQFIANLSLLTQFVGEDCNLTVKVVVAKDGENFSSDDVIGTITNDQLPTSDAEPVDFAFPFSGYTGNIRLGFYFEGTGSDMSWYELYRVAVLEDLSSVQSVKADNGDDKVYNLQGVQLNSPQRGINIVNGKKMVVK